MKRSIKLMMCRKMDDFKRRDNAQKGIDKKCND